MGFFLSPLRALGKGGLPAQTPQLFEVRVRFSGSRGEGGRQVVGVFSPQSLSLESLRTWPGMNIRGGP